MLNYMAAGRSIGAGRRPSPDGAHQSLVPSQTFATRDGWLSSW
jgi:hypothetical protein